MWRPVDRLGAGGEGAWLPALLPARHPDGVKAPPAIQVELIPNARKAHAYWTAALRGVESQSACPFPAYEQSRVRGLRGLWFLCGLFGCFRP